MRFRRLASKAEEGIGNRGKLGQSFVVCQVGEVQVRACGGLGKVAQVGVFSYGGGIQGVDWGFAVNELGLTEIGHPVGGEKELVAGIFRQVDDSELSCTVIGQFPQNLRQFLPVSLADGEFTGFSTSLRKTTRVTVRSPIFEK